MFMFSNLNVSVVLLQNIMSWETRRNNLHLKQKYYPTCIYKTGSLWFEGFFTKIKTEVTFQIIFVIHPLSLHILPVIPLVTGRWQC